MIIIAQIIDVFLTTIIDIYAIILDYIIYIPLCLIIVSLSKDIIKNRKKRIT